MPRTDTITLLNNVNYQYVVEPLPESLIVTLPESEMTGEGIAHTSLYAQIPDQNWIPYTQTTYKLDIDGTESIDLQITRYSLSPGSNTSPSPLGVLPGYTFKSLPDLIATKTPIDKTAFPYIQQWVVPNGFGLTKTDPYPVVDNTLLKPVNLYPTPPTEKVLEPLNLYPTPPSEKILGNENLYPTPPIEKILGQENLYPTPPIEKILGQVNLYPTPPAEKVLGQENLYPTPPAEKVLGNENLYPSVPTEKILDSTNIYSSEVILPKKTLGNINIYK